MCVFNIFNEMTKSGQKKNWQRIQLFVEFRSAARLSGKTPICTCKYLCTTVCAITSFCSFSMSTSRNSVFLRSVAVKIRPAESAPAAKASNSVAIASHCLPALIRSFARSFS